MVSLLPCLPSVASVPQVSAVKGFRARAGSEARGGAKKSSELWDTRDLLLPRTETAFLTLRTELAFWIILTVPAWLNVVFIALLHLDWASLSSLSLTLGLTIS